MLWTLFILLLYLFQPILSARTCAIGYYLYPTLSICLECPPGTFSGLSPDYPAADSETCTVSKGFYHPSLGPDRPWRTLDGAATACPATAYCPGGVAQPVFCNEGTSPAEDKCVISDGYYYNESLEPTLCVKEYFCRDGVMEKCHPETFSGLYSDEHVEGASGCSPKSGFYYDSIFYPDFSFAFTPPVPCPPGYACPGKNRVIKCPTYTTSGTGANASASSTSSEHEAGGTTCTPNDGYYYANDMPWNLLDRATLCPAGSACTKGTIEPCTGSYYAPAGSAKCTRCFADPAHLALGPPTSCVYCKAGAVLLGGGSGGSGSSNGICTPCSWLSAKARCERLAVPPDAYWVTEINVIEHCDDPGYYAPAPHECVPCGQDPEYVCANGEKIFRFVFTLDTRLISGRLMVGLIGLALVLILVVTLGVWLQKREKLQKPVHSIVIVYDVELF